MAGYNKRPLWQWVLIYLVIGAVVYGAIYYFMIANNTGGYSAPQSAPQTMPQSAPQTAPQSGSDGY